jgi:hypothetical protein
MPSMRPPTASDPDGPDGWRYRDLAEADPALANRLVNEYGRVWLSGAELPPERAGEVADTVQIAVAEEWETDEPGLKRLRLTSWYTGSTYWLPDWDGDDEKAISWIRDTAWLQAGNVRFQRYRYGRTTWDTEGEARDEPLRPDEVRAWLDADAEAHPYPP